MPSAYPQRALTVLLLLGTVSAAMALLSSSLIFQLPSVRASPGAGAGSGGGSGALPEPVAAALVPVPAALAALCLVLNVSCLLLCLLHGHLSTELCRGQPERAAWFLLGSRSLRHAAVGLCCCGLCLYLTALALFMLLQFPPRAGIAGASILTSGVLLLLLSLLHALLRASRASQSPRNSPNSRPEPSQALYENDSAQLDLASKTSAPEFQREFSFPPFPEGKSRPGSASSSESQREFQRELSQREPREFQREPRESQREPREFQREPREFQRELSQREPREFQRELSQREPRELARTHRTLSADSGLLREQAKAWNVIRNSMARKASGRDSTLV